MPCVGDTVQRVSRFPIALGPKQFPRRFKKTNRHYVVRCVTQIYQGGLSCRLERLIFSIRIRGIPSFPFFITEYEKGAHHLQIDQKIYVVDVFAQPLENPSPASALALCICKV